jgi:hypothetical protein
MTVFGAPAASPETPTPLPSAPDDTSAGTRSKAEELAKETQNPVAHLISVPFKWNMAFGLASLTLYKSTLKYPAGHPDLRHKGLAHSLPA